MHIPDGFVSTPVIAGGALIAAGGLAVCVRRARLSSREANIPLAGLAAAFFLVLEAPVFPIAAGTSGHLLGGTLAVSLLGPWLGAIVITVVTAVQTLFAGDGGISALGVNVVNLALVPAFIGYPLLLLARRMAPRGRTALAVACGVVAFVAVVVASVLFSIEYAIGGATGVPVSTVATTTIGTYLLVGVFEGVVTALIVRGLLAVRPDLVELARPRGTEPAPSVPARDDG